MSFAPLLAAPPTIQAHAFPAFFAIVRGAMQFALPKGVLWRQSARWAFAFVVILAAGMSFFINTINSWRVWSPIHLLSIFTRVTVPLAVWRVHLRDVARRRKGMIPIYVLALIVTGPFMLYPRRVMHPVFFRRVSPWTP